MARRLRTGTCRVCRVATGGCHVATRELSATGVVRSGIAWKIAVKRQAEGIESIQGVATSAASRAISKRIAHLEAAR